ncbi:hypothetical protein ACP43V_16055 [Vibrio genomosp. F10 str. 9ZC157]|uniref:hypothetical protein n=1 Tax=Vibrio genomosp. F10 TaxID=723171 RepID=UPI0002DE299B|nr:hypothetical protein [Vibrio genomosp. F10]OEE93469.1 hypothetical protein A1QM_09295 [Vibrio genomosp. F10 str. 9ZC157]
MSSWQSWKKKYSKQIEHVAGYEKVFVDRVLSQIPEISPNDVTPQHHFIDDNGGNRYIDFMILNKAKGYYLPIELDGTYKDVNHQKWKDFLVRQNSLITKFGIVLRFSNKQMLGEPQNVINKIRHTLDIQSKNRITEASKQKERDGLIAWYNQKLVELEKTSSNTESFTNQISELRGLVEEIRSTPQQPIKVEVSPEAEKSDGKSHFWIGVNSALAAVLLVGFFAINSKDEPTLSTRPQDVATLNSPSEPVPVDNVVVPTETPNIIAVDNELVEKPLKVEQPTTVDSWEEVPEDRIKQTLSNEMWPPVDTIPAELASKYEGAYNVVCGVVAQVTEFSRGTYLNFEKTFPDSPFSTVVWDSDTNYVLSNISSFDSMLHKKVCVQGNISTYNERTQIIVSTPDQIEVF